MVCAMTARQVSPRCSPRSSNPMRDDRTEALMSKEGLRNRLLGTWQLVSSVIRFEDGEFRGQLGYDPSGLVIQQQAQVRLREREKAMQQQNDQMAQLRAENERLSSLL